MMYFLQSSTAHMTVHRLKLLQTSWQPKILQVLVAQVAKGLISREEGAYAMRLQVAFVIHFTLAILYIIKKYYCYCCF